MPTYNIPKLARNKYNVVKDNVSNNVVTQTQLMNSFGSGNSSGGGIGITHNTFQQQAQVSSVIEKASYDIGLSTYSYVQSYFVAKDELNAASYVTQSQLSTNSYVTTTSLQSTLESYVTQSQLSTMSYATTTFVSEKCAEVQANAYAYTESKIVDDNLTSYNEVKQMIEDIIAYMKSTGELISAAAVDQKISDSRV